MRNVVVFCDGDRVFEKTLTISPGAQLDGGHQQCGDQDHGSDNGDYIRRRRERLADFSTAPGQDDENSHEREIRITIGHRLNADLNETNYGYQHPYKPEPSDHEPGSVT